MSPVVTSKWHCYKNNSPESDVFQHPKAYSSYSFQPTGIGLRFIVKRKQVRITNCLGILIIFFFLNLKLFILPKKYAHIKKIHKIYYSFSCQKLTIIGNTYIFTECIDNFKFSISLKSKVEKPFPWVPTNAGLFSITRFLYGWQKIFTNKIFSQNMIYIFCLYNFSLKWIIKKIIYHRTIPLYGLTFHSTPINLCIKFEWNIYIYTHTHIYIYIYIYHLECLVEINLHPSGYWGLSTCNSRPEHSS